MSVVRVTGEASMVHHCTLERSTPINHLEVIDRIQFDDSR